MRDSRGQGDEVSVPAPDVEEEEQENQPLLQRSSPDRGHADNASQPCTPRNSSPAAGPASKPCAGNPHASPKVPGKCKLMSSLHPSPSSGSLGGDMGICRICLEDESLSALEAPCACTGTQMYAHHACIQKWVNEKCTLRCEICDTDYKGEYAVPPVPPPALGPDSLPLVTPLGSLYLTIAAEQDTHHSRHAHSGLLDPWDDDPEEDHPPPISWCASLLIFLLFMMVLHHSMVITLPGQTGPGQDPTAAASIPNPPAWAPGATAAAAAAGHAGVDPTTSGLSPPGGFNPGLGPQPGVAAVLPGPGAAFLAGLSLFVVWLLTKVFLVALPVMTLMRLASRGMEEEAEEQQQQVAAQGAADVESVAAGSRGQQQEQLRRLFTLGGSAGLREVASTPRGLRQLLLLHRLRQVMAEQQEVQLQVQGPLGAGSSSSGGENRGSSGRPRLPNVV